MQHTNTQTGTSLPRPQFSANVVSLNLARAGRSANLLVGRTVRPGVITGVLTEAGKPRIVVGRTSNDVRQILTITPA